eukprot:TRINITY_DN4406_c0_g1_i1.p1 TRINITY_DN4406_c0_g1~~TRINITY_DN4406_c0_g1_i1.p1  ORF type:complete len:282 (+),score=75.31 TRINITY_DN4406_c0_g1_i1:335-1180(+)
MNSRQANFPKSEEYFEKMKSDLISPNPQTFQALLSVAGKSGNVPQVRKLFASMKKFNMVPHTFAYNQLLSANIFSKDIKGCLDSFTEMDKAGVPADLNTYHTVLQACAEAMNAQLAEKIWRKMKQDGIEMTIETIEIMLTVYSKAGRLLDAIQVLKETIIRRELRPTYNTFRVLLELMIERQVMVEEAVDQLKKIEKLPKEKFPDKKEVLQYVEFFDEKVAGFIKRSKLGIQLVLQMNRDLLKPGSLPLLTHTGKVVTDSLPIKSPGSYAVSYTHLTLPTT